MENFQSQSKKSGDAFEELVYADLANRGFGPIDRNYCFENVGCEVDFRAHSNTTFEFVEAKGGLSGEGKRPGAQRTDNVKKAIASGALYKGMYSSSTFVAYFSFPPNENSDSETSISVALNKKYFDDVVYILPEPENNIEIFLNG